MTEKLTFKDAQNIFLGYLRDYERECLEDPSKVEELLAAEIAKLKREKLLELASRRLNQFFEKIDLPYQEFTATAIVYYPMSGEESTYESRLAYLYKQNPEKRHLTAEDLYKILGAGANMLSGNRLELKTQDFLQFIFEHLLRYLQGKYINVPEQRLKQIARKFVNNNLYEEYTKYKKIREKLR